MTIAALAVKEQELDILHSNDNLLKEDSLAHLRRAINAPDKDEVRRLIKQEIVNWNTLNKVQLVTTTGQELRTLPDENRHFLFPEVLTVANAAIPCALVGPAGSGKSTMCRQIADALDLKYYLQNSVSGAHELAGYMDAHGRYNGTSFRAAFEHGGLLLVDEVDTSDAGALKWINTALANGHAMFPDSPDPIYRHKDFRIMIAANTFGSGADRIYVGANQLDASTLDRFVFFNYDYDEKLEVILSGNPEWAERVQALRHAAFAEKARIVISPRASIYGAQLLKAGWKQELVEQRVVWKGIDEELRKRILGHIEKEEIEKRKAELDSFYKAKKGKRH